MRFTSVAGLAAALFSSSPLAGAAADRDVFFDFDVACAKLKNAPKNARGEKP